MKKIVMYTKNLNPETGGIQYFAYYLLKEFKKKSSVIALSSPLPNEYKDECIFEMSDLNRLKEVKWILQNSNQDTITIVFTCWEGIPAYIGKKLKKASYILQAHGEDVFDLNSTAGGMKKIILRKIMKHIIKNSSVVCCNSRYTESLVKQSVKDVKTTVIHPPCHIMCDDISNITHDKSILFSMGRLVKRKGFQYVLMAMPEILKENRDVQYYIAGEGPYTAELVELTKKLCIEKNVNFLGHISEEDKIKYLRKCGLFLMPSIEDLENRTIEGFGIVYIEANSFGKYVVGSDTGGISDAIIEGKTGTLLHDVQPDKISDCVNKILRDFKDYYSDEAILYRINWASNHFIDKIASQYSNIISSF